MVHRITVFLDTWNFSEFLLSQSTYQELIQKLTWTIFLKLSQNSKVAETQKFFALNEELSRKICIFEIFLIKGR